MKQKTAKKGSSVARDLHSTKYRQRIVEEQTIDTNLLLEEGIQEYYQQKESNQSHTQPHSDLSLQKIPSTTSTGIKEQKPGQT